MDSKIGFQNDNYFVEELNYENLSLDPIEEIPDGLDIDDFETDPEFEKDSKQLDDIIKNSSGDELTPKERDELTEKNEALVHFVAKKFQNTRIDHDELTGIAYLGFTKALNGFKKNRGVKFSTYAHNCMYNEILFYLRKEKKHREKTVPMSNPVATDKDGHVFDEESRISSEMQGDERSLEDSAIITQAVDFLNEIINELTETEQFIIKSRYGLQGYPIKTQKEIADKIKMSQANISKLEKTILSKISKILTARYGIDHLDL